MTITDIYHIAMIIGFVYLGVLALLLVIALFMIAKRIK